MSNGSSHTETMQRLEDRVKEILPTCGNCAQTSFKVLQEQFDLGGDTVLRALTPFPGLALRGETCGAVTGSMMALGLVFGRDELSDWKGYIRSLPPARRFCRRFVEKSGSTMCGEILESEFGRRFDLADRMEAAEWLSSGAMDICGEVITSAAVIAADIIMSSDRLK